MAPPISVLAIITTQTLSVASGHAVRQAYSYSTVSRIQQHLASLRHVIRVLGESRVMIRALEVCPGIGYFSIPSKHYIYKVLLVYGMGNSLPENQVL